MKLCNIRYIFVAALVYTNGIHAQQVPQIAVMPGGNNAPAAGYGVANVLQPRFPTTAPGTAPSYGFVPESPYVLVGPMAGPSALLAPVTPFLSQSYFFGGRQ
jgi:hypothetical protein